MRRGHRSFHRLIWPLLAIAVAVGFSMALVLRPAPAAETPRITAERAR